MWRSGPFFVTARWTAHVASGGLLRRNPTFWIPGLNRNVDSLLNSSHGIPTARAASQQLARHPNSSCGVPAKRKRETPAPCLRPTGLFLVRFSPVAGLLAGGRYNVTVACAGTRTAGELRAVTPPRRGERRCHRSVTFSTTSSTSRITGRRSRTLLRALRTRLPRTQASARSGEALVQLQPLPAHCCGAG